MKFTKWAASFGGAPKLAAELGMKERSVYLWLECRGKSPTAKNVLRIVELAKGKLSCDDIVFETQGKKRKGKK